MFKWHKSKVLYEKPPTPVMAPEPGRRAEVRIIPDRRHPGRGWVDFAPERSGAGRVAYVTSRLLGPCLGTGRTVATPRGETPIERLRPGDQVITRDNGIQTVRWIKVRRFGRRMFRVNPHLLPILIEKGALGEGLPERAMLVSPNQRLLAPADKTAIHVPGNDAMVAAKHLLDNDTIRQVNIMGMTYVQVMFDKTEAVLSNGVWTETFHPHDREIGARGNAQRNELFELFPELKDIPERNGAGRVSREALRASTLHADPARATV